MLPVALYPSPLFAALEYGETDTVESLLGQGVDVTTRMYDYGTVRNMEMLTWSGLTGIGLAVLTESEGIEGYEAFAFGDPDERESEELTEGGRGIEYLPLFEGRVDLSGIHADGGQTLMHLAIAPLVAQWLLDHGAPFDVPNDDGLLPEEVVPGRTAAVIRRHRLLMGKPATPTIH